MNYNGFVITTAQDYDLDCETVQRYYNQYGSTPEFYKKLEELISCK